MMDIEELITYIKARLQESSQIVSIDDIRQILIEAGVAELLTKQVTVTSPKRLLVRRIYFRGFKEVENGNRTDPFVYSPPELQGGINVWVGDNDTGKSTILKCILWALTGKDPNLKGDIRQWLTEVAVEFWVNDQPHLIHLLPEPNSIAGSIYSGTLDAFQQGENLPSLNGFSDNKAMANAIENLFGTLLGFSPLKWLKPNQLSVNLSETSIRWDIYSQVMFIGDEEHSDYLFPRRDLNGRHHQRTLGMYLGLDLLEAVSTVQMARDHARHDYSLVKESAKRIAVQVKNSIQDAEKQLHEIEDKLALLEAGQSILTNETYMSEVSERVAAYARLVVGLTNKKKELDVEYQALLDTLHTAERSRQALSEAIKYRFFLNNLQIQVCPRCENQIEAIPEEEEISSGICRVCHNELKSVTSIQTHEELLVQLDGRITEQRAEQKQLKRSLNQLDKELSQAHENHNKEANILTDASRQAQMGFSVEMRDLLSQRGYLQGRLQELRLQTLEGQADRIEQAKLKVKILELAHKQLEGVMNSQHKGLLTNLERTMLEIAHYFNVKLQEVKFDSRLRMLVTQHGDTYLFERLTASEKLRVKLAFHLALLSQRLELRIGRHPALLIVDAPAPRELDEISFAGIADGLVKIQARFGDKFQLLIATTDSTLATVARPELVQEKRNKEPFF